MLCEKSIAPRKGESSVPGDGARYRLRRSGPAFPLPGPQLAARRSGISLRPASAVADILVSTVSGANATRSTGGSTSCERAEGKDGEGTIAISASPQGSACRRSYACYRSGGMAALRADWSPPPIPPFPGAIQTHAASGIFLTFRCPLTDADDPGWPEAGAAGKGDRRQLGILSREDGGATYAHRGDCP